MNRVRVLIADDHSVVRAGLRMLIASQPDMEVIGEAGDGAETIAKATATKPDVVVLDLSMPKSRSTQTIERLVRLDPSPRVLVLTMHDDPAYFRSALVAGASGYVVKNAADVELLTAIRAVSRGRTFVDLARPTDQEAAERLSVSIKTVETYRKRLHEKLELKSRAQLFRFAFESGLLEPDASLPDDK